MKTTVNIDDTVMVELKREAARQGRTISELVETALRLLLRSQRFPMLRRVRHRAARLARPRGSRPDPTTLRRRRADHFGVATSHGQPIPRRAHGYSHARARDRANLHPEHRFQSLSVPLVIDPLRPS